MGSKSSSPPDYSGAAAADAEASQNIALQGTYANRPDQNTPWGSSKWSSQDAYDSAGNAVLNDSGDPIRNWTQDLNLSDNQQRAFDFQEQQQIGRNQLGAALTGEAAYEAGRPLDRSQLPQAANTPDVPTYGNNLPQMGAGVDPNQFNTQGQGTPLEAGQLQRQLNTQGLNDVNAGGGYQDRFAQQQYDRNMSLQQPQMERDTQAMENRLRNQGLQPGSEAYDNAMNDLRNQQGERMGRMSQDAIMAGGQEQQNQFGREMSQRQQGMGEIGQQGQFFNQAGAQDFSQQQALRGQYGQEAQANYQRQMDTSRYADQQRQQLVGEQLGLGGQGFNQRMGAANYQNTLRQQAMTEDQQRRFGSLNAMNALQTGQQVGMPTMPTFNQATQPMDPQNLAAAQLYGQNAQANAANATSAFGSMMQAAGSASPSDARLKNNITKIGDYGPLDIVSWTWNGLLGLAGNSIGFIAQQVQEFYPEHVVTMSNGYLAIDYDALLKEV